MMTEYGEQPEEKGKSLSSVILLMIVGFLFIIVLAGGGVGLYFFIRSRTQKNQTQKQKQPPTQHHIKTDHKTDKKTDKSDTDVKEHDKHDKEGKDSKTDKDDKIERTDKGEEGKKKEKRLSLHHLQSIKASHKVAITPDGETVAIEKNGVITVFKVGKPEARIARFVLGGWTRVKSLALSSDVKWLAAGCNNRSVLVWKNENEKGWKNVVGFMCHNGWVRALDISPDGKYLASGDDYGMVRVWRTSDWKIVMKKRGHLQRVNYLCFSPNGKWFATVGNDRLIMVWAVDGWNEVVFLRCGADPGNLLAFSPNAQLLSAAIDNEIAVWSTKTWKLVDRKRTFGRSITGLAFSPDSKHLFCVALDKRIYFWECKGKLRLLMKKTLSEHESDIYFGEWLRDGRIVTVDWSGKMHFWSLRWVDFNLNR